MVNGLISWLSCVVGRLINLWVDGQIDCLVGRVGWLIFLLINLIFRIMKVKNWIWVDKKLIECFVFQINVNYYI